MKYPAYDSLMESGRPTSAPTRIVIVGGGFAGAYAAQAIERTLRRRDIDLVVFDRHNYFVFFPLLVEAGTGGLEPRHVIVPIRDMLKRGELRMAKVIDIDFDNREIRYRFEGEFTTQSMQYDQLVLAPGSVTRLPDVPGLREHGFGMKSLSDAVAVRDHAIRMLERANACDDPAERKRLLHFVVVGGNFTGVEVAGEFDEFVKRATERYRNLSRNDCRITLVEMLDRVLAALGDDLSDYALKHMRKRGIDVRLETIVNEVANSHVVLSTGETLPCATVIWCAGIEPNPLVKTLDLPKDEQGYILCERDLRVKGFDTVWSIGDCAVNIDEDGNAYPATAQHAVQQGKHLAKNLSRVLQDETALPCDLTTKGQLAALGCRTGVAKVFGIKLSGFVAWWLWRTVYLFKMPRLARKIRVALDWTIDLIFSRDYVQLGVHERSKSR